MAPRPRTNDPRPADDAARRGEPLAADGAATGGDEEGGSALEVLKNRPFLLLWLAQAATQIGGNMVIYGLTVIIFSSDQSNAAVSLLLLTFLVPAVMFSAVAGVYVDRLDRRSILDRHEPAARRGVRRAVLRRRQPGRDLPAEHLRLDGHDVLRTGRGGDDPGASSRATQLLAANGLFTLTLNAAFALGFALLGPLVVTVAGARAR